MRTKEEIKRQIDGLEAMKTWLPEFSKFGNPNHEIIDIQIGILSGEIILSDVDEGDWDDMDEQNKIYRGAENAETWLDGGTDDDLFEEK